MESVSSKMELGIKSRVYKLLVELTEVDMGIVTSKVYYLLIFIYIICSISPPYSDVLTV